MDLEAMRAALSTRLAVRQATVTLPRCGRALSLLLPADLDRLLDEAAGDPEQHLPHWAEVWASGVALADLVYARGAELAGRPVLELGSGLGVTACAALDVGADLLAVDVSTPSLDLCRYHALRNVGRAPRLLRANWRLPPPGLLDAAAGIGGFPLVLAADVLYERRDVAPLFALVPRLLAPDGALWLAEPGRTAAHQFLALADQAGWSHEVEYADGPWPDGTRDWVALHRLRLP